MKRICKILVILSLVFFVITGCNEENNNQGNNEETPKTNEYDEYNKKIDVVSLGKYDGEFGLGFAVLKITNNNPVPLYVNVHYDMYNSSKALIYSKDELVRVGSYKSAYAIGRQDPEENKFDSFSYNVEVRKEKINDYDETISSARASGKNDGSNIIVSLSNMGNRTTNIYGLVIFYNNGKIVEIKDATAYNVMPTGVRDVTVEYPYNLSFSKFEVIVNEVGTEL